jgi:hypothetical protein
MLKEEVWVINGTGATGAPRLREVILSFRDKEAPPPLAKYWRVPSTLRHQKQFDEIFLRTAPAISLHGLEGRHGCAS